MTEWWNRADAPQSQVWRHRMEHVKETLMAKVKNVVEELTVVDDPNRPKNVTREDWQRVDVVESRIRDLRRQLFDLGGAARAMHPGWFADKKSREAAIREMDHNFNQRYGTEMRQRRTEIQTQLEHAIDRLVTLGGNPDEV